MSRIVIVSAGDIAPVMRTLLRPDDRILACDAGYRRCEALGVQPDIILGDFDSAPQPQRPDLVVLPHVKDDTDTHYAAKLALQQGADEVLMLGALGGRRLEHTLANLSTGLWLTKQGVQTTLADAYSRITYVPAGVPRRYEKGEYQYLSVFPFEGESRGVCICGAFYPLQDATLTSTDFPLGVSNEFVEDTVEITCATGTVLVIETRAD